MIRVDTDCVIYFTPRSTGQQLATTNAHIYILTDLFLVCQHMEPEDKQLFGSDGPDMWLSYPPLAGKHLRVSDVQGGPGGMHFFLPLLLQLSNKFQNMFFRF